MKPADRRCLEIAATQCGALSRSQALASGLTPSGIDRRVASGRLVLVRPSAYVVAGVGQSREQELWVALLWAGEGAALSHATAAAMWGFEAIPDGPIALTSPRELRDRGLVVHRKRLLDEDVATRNGLRLTLPARTLLDLGDVLHPLRFQRCFHDALHRGLTSIAELNDVLARAGGRGVRGCTLLRTGLAEITDGDMRSQTTFERRLARLMRAGGIPPPIAQHEIFDEDGLVARTDFAYPSERVAIEADSYRWHANKQAWASDLERRNRLARAGWRVLHFTWTDVHRQPVYVIDEIRRALGL